MQSGILDSPAWAMQLEEHRRLFQRIQRGDKTAIFEALKIYSRLIEGISECGKALSAATSLNFTHSDDKRLGLLHHAIKVHALALELKEFLKMMGEATAVEPTPEAASTGA